MSNQPTTPSEPKVPAKGIPPGMEMFVLRYKHRQTNQEKNFYATDLESAIARGKKHCDTQRYRFIYVEPFVADLDAQDLRAEANS